MRDNEDAGLGAEEFHRGREAEKRRKRTAQLKYRIEQQAPPVRVRLSRGSEIKMQPTRWLWPGWLARGKLHILAGVPGAGKTTLALSLGAISASKRDWPDGSPCAVRGNIIIWSGEDAAEDTLCPRFAAMGGDLCRFFVISGVDEGGKSRSFDPAKDMVALGAAIEEIGGAALIIVDPIVSAVSGDSHKNAEVRRGLQPLVDLAARFDAAVVGITHFTKATVGRDPVDRLTGSLAFGALARVVMVAACSQDKEAPPRVLARAKSNIGPDGGGFAFGLSTRAVGPDGITAQFIEWGEKLEGTAREILARAEGQPEVPSEVDGGKLADAEALIREILATGPVDSKVVFDRCKAGGISKKTAYRAKGSLGVVAKKRGFGAGWTWELPAEASAEDGHELSEDAQHIGDLATFAKKPGNPGDLRRWPMTTFAEDLTTFEDGQDPPKMANEDGHWPPSKNINNSGASTEGGQASQGDVDLAIFDPDGDEWGEL